MRVLHIVPSLDPATGGPAQSVPSLCRALQQAGVNVQLYAFRRAGAPVSVRDEEERFAIRWFRPLACSHQWPTPSFYRCILQEARRVHLAHLHSLWNPIVGVAALACRSAGLPYLISPRGMLQQAALQRRRVLKSTYYRTFEKHTIEGAAGLHFFTEAEREDSQMLLDGKSVSFVIPNGIDPAIGERRRSGCFRRVHPELQGKRIALFLGRLHWSKGLELQAHAIGLAARKVYDLMWVLVGPDHGEWMRIHRLVRDLGFEDRVRWTGPLSRDECLEALAEADVFVLTSRHEAHSVAMNEALALGVPVVVTDRVRFDLIREYGAGVVTAPEPGQLAEAIVAVVRDVERARAMGEAGRRLAAERLAWPVVAQAMVAAYEVVGGTRKPLCAA